MNISHYLQECIPKLHVEVLRIMFGTPSTINTKIGRRKTLL